MTHPTTSAPAQAAEKVRKALADAGFPAARVGTSPDYGARPVAVAGYVVTEGAPTAGPIVTWDQPRLSADELDAKLAELETALTDAGFHVEREIRVDGDGVEWYGWTLEVQA